VNVVVFTGADVLHTQVAVPVSVHVAADMVVLVGFVVVVFDLVQLEIIGAAASRVSTSAVPAGRSGDGDEVNINKVFHEEPFFRFEGSLPVIAGLQYCGGSCIPSPCFD
jgi:hypothetical protein